MLMKVVIKIVMKVVIVGYKSCDECERFILSCLRGSPFGQTNRRMKGRTLVIVESLSLLKNNNLLKHVACFTVFSELDLDCLNLYIYSPPRQQPTTAPHQTRRTTSHKNCCSEKHVTSSRFDSLGFLEDS